MNPCSRNSRRPSVSLLLGVLGVLTRVDSEGSVVITDLSDEILCVKISDHLSRDRAVDLELVDHLAHGDGQELGCFLGNSVVKLGVEEDSVVQLFLYLDLGPALLLGFGATGFLSWESSGLGGLALISLGIFALVSFLGLYSKRWFRGSAWSKKERKS